MIFIINTITSWDEPPRCRHQVTMELAKNHMVFFIEKNRLGSPKLLAVHEDKNLTRIIPYWPVDSRIRTRIPIINEAFQFFLFTRLKNLLRGKQYSNIKVVNFDFTAWTIFFHFKHKSIIYYCNDEFIGNTSKNFFFINKYQSLIEKKIIQESSYCIATSDYLYKKLLKINNNTHLICLGGPNAVPPEFKRYTNKEKNIKKIRIAYVGFMLYSKFDAGWIKKLTHDKRFEFLLIGPANKKIKEKLSNSENIKFLGVKTGNDLLHELSQVHVCICPYNLNKINPGTTPNKLWPYLALGKPVVITQIPNMESWTFEENIIFKTNDNMNFPELIEKAFTLDSEELFNRRISIAQKNSWANRVNQFLSIVS